MTKTAILKFRVRNPRRNLPSLQSRKRKEANFVGAFSRAYMCSCASNGFGGHQFSLSGFGIADFIWIAWSDPNVPEGGSALSLEQLTTAPPLWHLTAFEMKLCDWRKGLNQAFRYSYFADNSILVLPPGIAKVAEAEIGLFKDLNVGLWSFENKGERIQRIFTPRMAGSRNPAARARAMEMIRQRLQFSKLFKQIKPFE
jgi:hypothetical protein